MDFNKLAKIFDFFCGFWNYNFVSKFRVLTPRSLIINITYQCNSQCIMCNIWKLKPQKELEFNDWKKIMADPIFNNIKELTISGGEAFLYDEFLKTIKLFIDSMPNLNRLTLNTNGFATEIIIKNINKISEYCNLKKIKLSVSVSIDGVGESHDNIRNIKNGFNKANNTLKKIKILSKKNKFDLNVASLLMNKNINEYKDIKNYFKKKGINHNFQLIGFHETYVNNLNTQSSLNFNKENKNTLIKVLNDLKKPNKLFNFNSYYWNDMSEMYKNNKKRSTPCPFLKDSFSIDSLGDIYYCLSVEPIGNFIKEKKSISDIYFDSKNINFRDSLWNTECKYCNSGCENPKTVAYDLKKYLWFKLKQIFHKSLNIFLL